MTLTVPLDERVGLQLAKLHLGCGSRHLEGWMNVDLDAPQADLRHDLTRPLPFASSSVSHIYCEHFIEHVTKEQGLAFLKECWRVLAAGGHMRLSTPDLRYLLQQYLQCRVEEWHDMGWRPAGPCDMVNEGMRLWGHQYVYDADALAGALAEAGFSDLRLLPWGASRDALFHARETRPWHHELIFEARKAG